MKKFLSLALILFLIFSIPVPNVFAAGHDLTLAADGTWASSGTPTGADVAHATAGDNVALDSTAGDVTLTVTNNGTANDGSGVNTFVLGNITDVGAANAENVLIIAPAAAAGNLSVTMSSATTGGTFIVQNTNNTNKNVTATVTNALTVGGAGGDLTVANNETTNDGTSVGLTVGGNLTVGNAALVNAATGAGAGANATLTLQGAANTFTAGLSLNDNAAGTAALTLSGTDQTVTGTIDGSAAGEGTININNTGNATFASNIGNTNALEAVNIASAGTKTADFNGVVKATTVTVSGAGTGNFDGAITATALNITSTGEAELNAASAITTTTLTGAGTLDLDATLTGNVVFGSGGDGTVALAGGSGITGSVNNSTASAIGTLTVESGGNSTITGAVGDTMALKAVNVQSAAGQIADFDSTVDATTVTVSGAGKGNFDGAVTATALNITSTGEAELNSASAITTTTFTGAGTLDLDSTLTGNVVFGAGGDGVIELLGGSGITGTIDNSTGAAIGTLTVEAGGDSTITGAVGNSRALNSVNVESAGGQTTDFNSTVAATTVTVSGAGKSNFDGAVTATALNITSTGEAELNTASTITTTTLTGAGTLDLDATLTGNIVLGAGGDGFVTLAGGSNIGGSVDNTSGGVLGTLTLEAGGNSTVTGAVGSTDALTAVNIQSAAGQTADFDSTVTATTVTVSGAGTSNFDGAVTATALNITSTGEAELNAASAITTTTLTGAGTLDLDATLTGDIAFGAGGDGLVTLLGGAGITGTVDNTAGGTIGTLTVESGGNSTITGTVGGTNALKAVNVQSITGQTADFDSTVDATTVTVSGAGKGNFDGAVTATALNITSTGEAELNAASAITTTTLTGAGTLDLDATLTGDVVFGTGGDGFVTLLGGTGITGSVDNTTAAAIGTLTVEAGGNSTITGAIGDTTALKAVDVQSGAGQTADFDSAVDATTVTVSGAGKGNFDGAVTATALNITSTGEAELNAASAITTTTLTGAGTLDIDANLTGDVVFGTGGDGVVTLLGGSGITGSVDNTTAAAIGTFTVEAGGNSSISGNIGNTTALKLINIQSAGGQTATLNGTVKATDLKIAGVGTTVLGGDTTSNIDFDANGVLNLNNGVDLTGTIVNSTDGTGTVNYLGSSVTGGNLGVATTGDLLAVNVRGGGVLSLAHNIAAITTTIDSANDGGTLTLTGSRTVTGDLTLANSGVLNLGANTLTLGGTGIYTQSATGTLNTTITNTTTYGNIAASGNAAVAGGTVYVTVGPTYIPSGSTFTILDGAAGGAITVPTILDDSYVLRFTGAASAGDLILTANRINTLRSATIGDSNTEAAAEALDSAAATTSNSDMRNVIDIIDGFSNNDEIENSIKTMTPNVSSGAMQASLASTGQFLGSVSNRLGFARSGLTGIATGDMIQGMGFWAQGLGSHLRQHERNGIQGYSANLLGISMGADKLLDQHVRVGLAGGYGYGAVNSKTPGSPTDDINSFSGALYGSFDSINLEKAGKEGKKSPAATRSQLQNNWYTDGMFTFTQNNYESRREIWITPTNRRVAKADHYGQQYTTKMETGYTMVFEATKNLETTPFASLRYSYLRMNKYSEKGADSLDLTVRGEGYNQLEQGLGVKFAYPIESKKAGTFIPAVKAAWLFDYIADQFETTAAFAGGGTSFETKGAKPARSGLLLGTELAFLNRDNLTLTANYDMELKDAFISNTYYLTARLDF